MIDLSKERLLTFVELARTVPRRKKNRPLAVTTLHRWRTKGIRQVRLEAVRLGGSWMTSTEAYHRFVHEVTHVYSGQRYPAHPKDVKHDKKIDTMLDVLLEPTVKTARSSENLNPKRRTRHV